MPRRQRSRFATALLLTVDCIGQPPLLFGEVIRGLGGIPPLARPALEARNAERFDALLPRDGDAGVHETLIGREVLKERRKPPLFKGIFSRRFRLLSAPLLRAGVVMLSQPMDGVVFVGLGDEVEAPLLQEPEEQARRIAAVSITAEPAECV